MLKDELRKKVLLERKSLTIPICTEKSHEIIKRLKALPCVQNSRILMLYMDFNGEVQTTSLLADLLKDGKRVALPKTIEDVACGKNLQAIEVKDGMRDIEVGRYGIQEPVQRIGALLAPSLLDLVIVPGVVFDRKGFRIGYGAGYYDAFLKQVRKDCIKIGLAYQMQMRDCVPRESQDIPVDMVITECEIIN